MRLIAGVRVENMDEMRVENIERVRAEHLKRVRVEHMEKVRVGLMEEVRVEHMERVRMGLVEGVRWRTWRERGCCTGCSITPCSALSQASCRSPNDRRGTALLPEDVGGPVGVTIYKKASAKAAIADNSGQTPRGSGDRHAVFAVADFATLFGDVVESCFLSKKVAKWYKRLKDC
jgi:hypothetical protein